MSAEDRIALEPGSETGGVLCGQIALHPGEPLHRRAPTRDERGRPHGDFMMLIPGLRSQPAHVIQAVVRELHCVLTQLGDLVVFADLNLKLNVLWVTIRPGRNVAMQVAATIHARVPEAKLVAADFRYC
jgi:hypothetical protein